MNEVNGGRVVAVEAGMNEVNEGLWHNTNYIHELLGEETTRAPGTMVSHRFLCGQG